MHPDTQNSRFHPNIIKGLDPEQRRIWEEGGDDALERDMHDEMRVKVYGQQVPDGRWSQQPASEGTSIQAPESITLIIDGQPVEYRRVD